MTVFFRLQIWSFLMKHCIRYKYRTKWWAFSNGTRGTSASTFLSGASAIVRSRSKWISWKLKERKSRRNVTSKSASSNAPILIPQQRLNAPKRTHRVSTTRELSSTFKRASSMMPSGTQRDWKPIFLSTKLNTLLNCIICSISISKPLEHLRVGLYPPYVQWYFQVFIFTP